MSLLSLNILGCTHSRCVHECLRIAIDTSYGLMFGMYSRETPMDLVMLIMFCLM